MSYTDQLWVVDVGDGVCKVRETVPDVLTSQSTRLPEARLKVALRNLQTCRGNITPTAQTIIIIQGTSRIA